MAVVLFNLGGPDKPDAVKPFLFNLFNDPAIIGAPKVIRWLLAKVISSRRAPVAREIYQHIGGKSPLLDETEAQAASLTEKLETEKAEYRVFIAMRYWHPFARETARAVSAFAPTKIILLPLYPQFSTTTSGSSFVDWQRASDMAGLSAPTVSIGCYPVNSGLIHAHADGVRRALEDGDNTSRWRVLFSAHGLPEKIVEAGDPYQWQIEQTANGIVNLLSIPGLDWRVCYQSRVGPLKWIGPSTEEEIEQAGKDGVNLIVVPIAFVSEHSETLVELDIEYRDLAEQKGVPQYRRVPALGTSEAYIDGLARLVRKAVQSEPGVLSEDGRICPADRTQCPCRGSL